MLSIYEEVVLLAFDDEKGTPERGSPEIAIAAALLADLADRGRVGITDDKETGIELLDSTPTGDSLLDELIDRVASERRARTMAWWIERISVMRDFRTRVTARLVERGVLEVHEHKILRVFPTTRYPEADPQPEHDVVERLRRAIFSDVEVSEVSERDCLLVGIAKATKLLRNVFDRRELDAAGDRIEQLTDDVRIADQTRRAVVTAQALMATVAISSATIAGSS